MADYKTQAVDNRAAFAKLKEQFSAALPINIVDVGANQMDHERPYQFLVDQHACQIVGFEPQEETTKELEELDFAGQERYFPYALGDGGKIKLHIYRGSGLTSSRAIDRKTTEKLTGLARGAQLRGTQDLQTKRLDDIDDVGRIDFLKIDIQGGEQEVISNAREKLKSAFAVMTEVNYFPFYEDQPSFASLHTELQSQGFQIFKMLPPQKRYWKSGRVWEMDQNAKSQWLDGDVIYLRDLRYIDEYSDNQLRRLALMAFSILEAPDIGAYVLEELGRRNLISSDLIEEIFLMNKPDGTDSLDAPVLENVDADAAVDAPVKEIEETNPKSDTTTPALAVWPKGMQLDYYDILYSSLSQMLQIDRFGNLPAILENQNRNPDIDYQALHIHWEERAIKKNRRISWDNVNNLKETVLAFKAAGKPVIWTVHNEEPHANIFPRIFKHIRGFMVEQADQIHVHSEAAKSLMMSQYGVEEERLNVIHCPAFRSGTTMDMLKAANPDHTKKTFLTFGRMRGYKGVDQLVTALSNLKNGDHIQEFIFAGPGKAPSKPDDWKQPFAFEVDNDFLANDVLDAYLMRASVGVIPYSQVLTSGSVMHACAMGLPVIVPDIGGLREQIPPENAHLLVESNDPEALGAKIDEVALMSNEQIFQLKANALRFAEEYSPKNQSEKLVALYKKMHIV